MGMPAASAPTAPLASSTTLRSEEHTSELQSRQYLVCRLLLEKKKKNSKKQPKQHDEIGLQIEDEEKIVESRPFSHDKWSVVERVVNRDVRTADSRVHDLKVDE